MNSSDVKAAIWELTEPLLSSSYASSFLYSDSDLPTMSYIQYFPLSFPDVLVYATASTHLTF